MPFLFPIKKHISISCLFALFITIFFTGCKKKPDIPYSSVNSPHFIGQALEGGIVAYIFKPGEAGYVAGESHGLIAAASDLDSSVTWGCTGTTITGARDAFLGSGQQNTLNIVKICGSQDIAANYCDQLDLNGYDDWYLPSKMELEKLYLSSVHIGGFNYMEPYWSSTQSNMNNAWMFNFSNERFIATGKYTRGRVRAVRSF